MDVKKKLMLKMKEFLKFLTKTTKMKKIQILIYLVDKINNNKKMMMMKIYQQMKIDMKEKIKEKDLLFLYYVMLLKRK